jgi:hypothetical protein
VPVRIAAGPYLATALILAHANCGHHIHERSAVACRIPGTLDGPLRGHEPSNACYPEAWLLSHGVRVSRGG